MIKAFVKKNLYQNKFAQSVLTLATGTTIAQIIAIITSPILSRLYSPRDFGLLALYVSVVSITSVVATGQYEIAIVLPKENKDAINVAAVSILITCLTTIASLVLVIHFNPIISNLLDKNDIGYLIYFLPIIIFQTGFYQVLNYWSNRQKYYKDLAFSQIIQSIFTTSISLTMGISGIGINGLIVGTIMGQGLAVFYLILKIWNKEKSIIKFINKEAIITKFIEYQNFPKYIAPQSIMDNFRNGSILFLISFYFNSTVLGYYSFANKIMQTPFRFIGDSVAQVSYQKISSTYNGQKNVWNVSKKILVNLSIICFPIIVLIILFSPNLFVIIFGDNWRQAGYLARILAPWIFINFIVSPVSCIPLILGKQKEFFVVGLVNNVTLPAVLLVYSYLDFSINEACMALSFFGILYLVCATAWIRKISINYTN